MARLLKLSGAGLRGGGGKAHNLTELLLNENCNSLFVQGALIDGSNGTGGKVRDHGQHGFRLGLQHLLQSFNSPLK